jgi:hypothetical protein
MAIGVTTLAQLNGVDGLGDDSGSSSVAKYIGYGAIAVAVGAIAWYVMKTDVTKPIPYSPRMLGPNKRRRRRHRRSR